MLNEKKYRIKLNKKISFDKFKDILKVYDLSENKKNYWHQYIDIIDSEKNIVDNNLFQIEFIELKEDREIGLFQIIDQNNKNFKLKLSFADLKRINKQFFSQNNKIKYLAFGDSITEGFSEEYGMSLPGDNGTNKITGNSYPSYFANGLNLLVPGIIEEYNNYSLSSTTIKDWIKILNNNFDFLKDNDELKINLNNKNNPFISRTKDLFDNFTNNEKFIKKFKEANVITMTLGGNDLLSSHFIKKVLIEKMSKFDFIEQVDIVMKKTRIIFTDFLVNLRKINKNAYIYILSYTNSIVRIKELINQYIFIYEDKSIKDNIVELTIDKINEMIVQAIINANKILKRDDLFAIDFVDIYDKEKWELEAFENNKMLFGFHPTNMGYQKIALNLLTKIIFNNYSNDFFESNFKNLSQLYIKTKNSKIKSEFNVILDSENDSENTILKIVDILNKNYYKNNLELSKKYEHLQNSDFAIDVCLSRMNNEFFKQLILKFIEKWIFIKYKIFSIESIKKFNIELFDSIYALLVKHMHIIKHLFHEFEDYFTMKKINIISDKDFIDAIYYIFENKNFAFEFIQMLLDIPNMIKTNSLLIQVINDLVINIKNNDIIKKIITKNIKSSLGNLITFIPEKVIEEFLNNIILAEENITHILEIFRSIITNNNVIAKAKDLSDMFRIILKLSFKEWILIFKNIYNKVQKNPFYNIYIKQRIFGSLYPVITKTFDNQSDENIVNNFEKKYIENLFSNFTYDSKLIILLEKWFAKKEKSSLEKDINIDNIDTISFEDIQNLIYLLMKMNPEEIVSFINLVISTAEANSKFLNIFSVLEKKPLSEQEFDKFTETYSEFVIHFINHFNQIKTKLSPVQIDQWENFFFRIITIFEFFIFTTNQQPSKEQNSLHNKIINSNKELINKIYSQESNEKTNIFSIKFNAKNKNYEEAKKYLYDILVKAKIL